MLHASKIFLMVSVFSLASACGSATMVGETEAPAKQKNSQDAKDKSADENDTDANDKEFANDTDDTQSLLEQETAECNAKNGILLNDTCNVCSAGQTADAGTQTCLLGSGQDSSTPAGGNVGGSGDSIDPALLAGLATGLGELIKNLPPPGTGGGPGGPGGGGCGG